MTPRQVTPGAAARRARACQARCPSTPPCHSAELEAWLTRYGVGGLVEQAPIASGIENTATSRHDDAHGR
ncbi:MAG: hypothetical protein IPO75_03630 [Betaproteobacteria bacterium]|nr:hypothetical protein [Betaproteobacteria bacterium]